MEQLHNGFLLDTPAGTFPLSTDSILLADFVRLPKQANVLDLGAGCGTLGILLCAKDKNCRVTGIEIDETAHQAALENIRRNGLDLRMKSICADLRCLDRSFLSGAYDLCISNPPYFTGGPASKVVPTARRNDHCNAEQLMATAAEALRYGADLYLVQKPENLAHLCGCAIQNKLEPKRLRLVRHHAGSELSLVLLQCRKGGKPGLIWEELTLFHRDGTPTEEYKNIYHL